MSRFLFVAIFLVFACNQPKQNSVEKPDDLIPRDKMVLVLVDVHLMEASLNVHTPQAIHHNGIIPVELKDDSAFLRSLADPKYQQTMDWFDIFQKHGYTKKQYEASMKWYCSEPEILNGMYDDVITELTKRQIQSKAGTK